MRMLELLSLCMCGNNLFLESVAFLLPTQLLLSLEGRLKLSAAQHILKKLPSERSSKNPFSGSGDTLSAIAGQCFDYFRQEQRHREGLRSQICQLQAWDPIVSRCTCHRSGLHPCRGLCQSRDPHKCYIELGSSGRTAEKWFTLNSATITIHRLRRLV